MRTVIVCMLLVAGCPRHTTPRPTLPDVATTRFDGAMPDPPSHAEPAGTVPLDLSAGVLDEVALPHVEAVLSWFAADPGWRVSELDGPVAAVRRWDDAGAWVTDRAGVSPSGTRTLVRFLSWNRGNAWGEAPTITRVAAADASAALGLWHTDRGVVSALVVDGVEIGIEVFEVGDRGEGTRAGLRAATDALRAALAGGAPEAVPEQPLTLRYAGPGALEATAALNPGKAGWTWLRLVQRGVPWHELDVAIGTREAIGWSSDPDRAFWLQSRFGVPPGAAFRADAEVWFLSAEPDAEPVLLHTVRLTVPRR